MTFNDLRGRQASIVLDSAADAEQKACGGSSTRRAFISFNMPVIYEYIDLSGRASVAQSQL